MACISASMSIIIVIAPQGLGGIPYTIADLKEIFFFSESSFFATRWWPGALTEVDLRRWDKGGNSGAVRQSGTSHLNRESRLTGMQQPQRTRYIRKCCWAKFITDPSVCCRAFHDCLSYHTCCCVECIAEPAS